MRTLTDDQLNNKIDAFLTKKKDQYPEIFYTSDNKVGKLWNRHGNVKKNAQLTWQLLTSQRSFSK